MTAQDFVDKVWELLIAGAEPDLTPLGRNEPELETACDNGLQFFAQEIAHDELRYHQLQRELAVTLTNGVGQLPADLLPESLDHGWIRDAQGTPLSKTLYFLDLTLPQSTLEGYYCLQNNRIYTRQVGTGSLTGTPGPLAVFGNIQLGLASIANLPSTLENDALDRVVAYIRPPAAPPAE